MRGFLLLLALLLVACSSTGPDPGLDDPQGVGEEPEPARSTGDGLPAFDNLIPGLLKEWDIPGAGVAVTVDERLVLARGYGLADIPSGRWVEPDTRFRIASLSKPITAVAVMQLIAEGTIRLDDSAFGFLPDLEPAPGDARNPDLEQVTIRHLLYHFGGWDRDKGFDPMFIPVQAARALQQEPPAAADIVVRYMLGEPLNFPPGSSYAYSNFGYAVLGRLLERVSGTPYEEHVRRTVLAPAGVKSMMVGRSRVSGSNEATYYDYQGAPLVSSVFPPTEARVQRQYGGFYLEAMDSHGGWTSSAVDLVRFLTAVDGAGMRGDVIGPSEREAMLAHPGMYWGTAYWYSMGWERSGAEFSHTGALPGTSSYMGCRFSVCIAAVLNSWPQDRSGYFSDLKGTLWQAAASTDAWPQGDLFERYE